MHKLLRFSAPALLALALAASAGATHTCYGNSPVMHEVAGFYVVVDEVAGQPNGHGYFWSVWVYMESNGEPGLQRGGCYFIGDSTTCIVGDRDYCIESASPDTLIYPL